MDFDQLYDDCGEEIENLLSVRAALESAGAKSKRGTPHHTNSAVKAPAKRGRPKGTKNAMKGVASAMKKAAKAPMKAAKGGKRTMSEEGRKKISEAMKRRWANRPGKK